MSPICPITQEPIKDPYSVSPCGHTFEKDSIMSWHRINPTCPLDRKRIDPITSDSKVAAALDWSWLVEAYFFSTVQNY